MAQCEVCGNDYDMSFEVHAQGVVHVFDSFECAIHRMAPVCEHCGVRIAGHGVEADRRWFCCAHCAREEGANAIVDRIGVSAGQGM
ncbi:hypothetical protein [Streptosporangium subroseum]|uniref:hypothetical protein n=1 Tax=Streptosporangium subroseum TaxID=106412 RepID=UPI003087C302|nr:hypothetical protein OHB15_10890 [Streptosporangium subroseum]